MVTFCENLRSVGDVLMAKKQIKSKQRVADYGEVYTNDREVKAMCDLVKDETERIDSRFLEPACGNGNFLAEILTRKLGVCKRKYKRSPLDYESIRYSQQAPYTVSIYCRTTCLIAEGVCLQYGTSSIRLYAKVCATNRQKKP